jgi:hypothetical protein
MPIGERGSLDSKDSVPLWRYPTTFWGFAMPLRFASPRCQNFPTLVCREFESAQDVQPSHIGMNATGRL